MTWWDDDDPYDVENNSYATLTGYEIDYDSLADSWSCNCGTYERQGSCRHLFHFRRQETVFVSPRYL